MTRRRHETSSLKGCSCISDRRLYQGHWAGVNIDAGATSAHPRTLRICRGFQSLGTRTGRSRRCRRQAQLTVDRIDRTSWNSHRRRRQYRRGASGDAWCKEARREESRICRHHAQRRLELRTSSTLDFQFKPLRYVIEKVLRRCHVA